MNEGRVTVYDLESANGMRVNGISASRAVLETGDILKLGEVRFRFLPAEGTHSLVPLPEDAPDAAPSSPSSRKLIVAVFVIAVLFVAAAGAVLVNYAKTYFTATIPEMWLFALGALFVLVTLLLPRGLVGLLTRPRRAAHA